jgi:predicted membrane-bound mannosyltransferase/sugar lactone lactonase YvrE
MNKSSLTRPIFSSIPFLTWEILFFGLILVLAAITRFLVLGDRVMSHDESLHTYYAWRYSEGFGYQHNPMMHGPFQFHILALIYFLIGASDFTSRIPAALFSLATIWMVWYWRRYIGNWGAIIAAVMLVASPYMLFYGRYTRNEAFVGLYAIIMLYAVLRYFETGLTKYLYLIAITIVFHLITKETSYIYAGELLIFLSGYLVVRVTERRWNNASAYRGFIMSLAAGLLLLGAAVSLVLISRNPSLANPATLAPANPNTTNAVSAPASSISLSLILGGLSIVAIGFSIFFLLFGYGLSKIRAEHSFDLLVLVGTLILPTLSAPLTKLFGGNPLDYSLAGLSQSAIFLIPLLIASVVIGLWWNAKIWATTALIFWGVFITFYTSMFTYSPGFFSGLIGSLGYWLEQQPVQRGSQPLYYYLLLQIPVYEFLPAFGSILALYYGFRHKTIQKSDSPESVPADNNYFTTFSLLAFWTISSLVIFTFAGERMPWLTFHIALPMILLGGWGIGQLIERIDWYGLRQRHAMTAIVTMSIFLLSTLALLYMMLGATPPFQGKELDQLQSTGAFILGVFGTIVSAAGLWYLMRDWVSPNPFRLGVLTFSGILLILTMRASMRANFWTYDQGTEYLVYAHGSAGVKEVLRQIKEISYRTTGSTKNIAIAYDDDTAWPMTWYLRDFPNQRYYGSQPGPDLGDVPVIIVGDNNYGAVEPIVHENYYQQDFIRMVWPNMDYFNLNWERIKNALLDKNIRGGLLDIWFFRNYSRYAEAISPYVGQVNTQAYTPAEWNPADWMRLYIRKDLAAQMWEYGSSPMAEIPPDPYEQGKIDLVSDLTIGSAGSEPGLLNAPRGLAVAPDGSIYVADSRNNRIQHYSPAGEYLSGWGAFANSSQGEAPLGSFNEPWGVAVAKDGTVFVSDTWNHRIQKFSPDGKPVIAWGVFGQSNEENGFYGPRGIAIDPEGRIYIADTGNNRVVIYNQDGDYIAQFGSPGVESGQFSEPVDVFVDSNGLIYVTDTWNQRVQVFAPSADMSEFLPVANWSISGWYGASNENKPYITVDQAGHVYITDPEGYRVIEFEGTSGRFLQTWGSYGTESGQFNLPSGIAADSQGYIWVSDSGNNRIMRFSVPQK